MDPIFAAVSLAMGTISLSAGRVVAANDGTNDEVLPFAAQLGVFAVCLAVALYMLRRSDQRDVQSKAAELAAHEKAQAVLTAQLDAERRRAEAAEVRNDKLEERLFLLFPKGPGEQA